MTEWNIQDNKVFKNGKALNLQKIINLFILFENENKKLTEHLKSYNKACGSEDEWINWLNKKEELLR